MKKIARITKQVKDFLRQRYLFLLPAGSFLFFLITISSLLMQNVSEKKAAAYEQFAKHYPPSSYEAKRFQSIADAIRKGKHTYSFSMPKVPMSLGK